MRALFFDLDGTLTDSAPGITRCLAHAFAELGAHVPDDSELRRCIGPPLDHTFRRLLPELGDAEIARAIALYRERFVAHGMYENAVYDGIPECLAALRDEGLRLFVVTAKPERFAKEIVRHFALGGFFEAVYGPSEDGVLHDKGVLVAHVLRSEGIAAERATMIGDRAHDVLGARKNGVRALGALWGYGSRTELEGAGAHALVAHPAEIARALAR
ncbi:MAG: HAD family hydrolase [Deltaproteobacteria bacterium]|nr:HAD family hydrolase [Deltaproteobacteria bacterium]